jgi:hypothetical protein
MRLWQTWTYYRERKLRNVVLGPIRQVYSIVDGEKESVVSHFDAGGVYIRQPLPE